jgi:hypothetical protein
MYLNIYISCNVYICMVKKEINEIRLPNFTADLSLHSTIYQYIEKVIVHHYDDAIHPAQDCYTDCVCQCYACWLSDGGCDPSSCVPHGGSSSCMKYCLRSCDEGAR